MGSVSVTGILLSILSMTIPVLFAVLAGAVAYGRLCQRVESLSSDVRSLLTAIGVEVERRQQLGERLAVVETKQNISGE